MVAPFDLVSWNSLELDHALKLINRLVVETVMHLSVSSPRGSGNPRKFDCGVYPQGGDFDRTSCI